MAFSSKQENDYESQLEQIAGEVDSYIVKTDGSLEYFREQIKPLAQRWKTYQEAVDKEKKELLDHWEKVKKNPTLQDKNIKQSENWEWDKFYLHGLGSFGSNPINEMPAKYALDVMAALEKYLKRNEKNEQGYPENSSEYKRLQEAIAEQRQNLEDIRSEFDKVSSNQKNNIWIKTPPKTVIPNRTYFKFTWWRYLNLPDEAVFGCWRPPLTPLPEYPLKILKPLESGQRNQARKVLPDARNPQEEYERYYIFLSSVHDNYLQGVKKITEGIWFDNLSIAVLCCLNRGHGDKTAFLKSALERIKKSTPTSRPNNRLILVIKKTLEHPVWTGIGVIIATILGVIALIGYREVKPISNDSIVNINTLDKSSINNDFLNIIKKALISLDNTENKGTNFDYWPSGGLLSVYDHLRTFVNYRTLVKIVPVPIYTSGPHSNISLSLNERYEFGHYNPEFIKWLDRHISILTEDGKFIKKTKPLFDKYLCETAFAYWECYRYLDKDKELKEYLKTDYLKRIDEKTLPEKFYYDIAWDSEQYKSIDLLGKKYNINVVAPAIYFWIRRSIDSTDEDIYKALDKILRAYYPARIFNKNL